MSSFDWKKNIEDSLRDGLIITIGATRIFLGLKALGVKSPDVYWWNLWRGVGERLCSLQKMDQRVNTTKILQPL